MALAIPRAFGPLAGPIPLSYLDADFTAIAQTFVASIAELRTVPKTGSGVAITLGYYVAGDNRQLAYYYDAADTTSADNGGSIIVAADGGRWKLSLSGVLSVKDFGAKGDGVSDDTVAFAAAFTAARALGSGTGVFIPATANYYLVSSTLNCTNLYVFGDGDASQIRCSAAQVDVLLTAGFTRLAYFMIHGGWDGATAGQSGHSLRIDAGAGSFAYNVHVQNVRILNSKQDGVYVARGGYTSFRSVRCNASGLHGLELFGDSAALATTTVFTDGGCVFSDTPNGRGIKMTECIHVGVSDTMCENTNGWEIAGVDNRNISFTNAYQESNVGGAGLMTWTGAVIGVGFRNVHAVGISLPYSANALQVEIGADCVFTLPGTAPGWKINRAPGSVSSQGSQSTTSTTGGATLSGLVSLTLAPGIWLVRGTLQTLNNAGAVLVSCGLRLSALSTDFPTDLTGASFVPNEVTVGPHGASAQSRATVTVVYENTTGANQTYYLNGAINISAGTIAYQAYVEAVRVG